MTFIRVIDTETTGMEPPAEIVEAAYCDVIRSDKGVWSVQRPVSWLCGVKAIPPEVRAIHHITMAEVHDATPFDADDLLAGGPDVLAAHNWDFDSKFIGEVCMPTICTYKAALRVWPEAPGHSNGTLRYWLEDRGHLALDHDLAMPPHRAGPDAYVTAHILKVLLSVTTAREMVAWTKEPRLLPTCPLGKFRGFKWADVESGFLNWMLNQATMEEDLKWNARRELENRDAA